MLPAKAINNAIETYATPLWLFEDAINLAYDSQDWLTEAFNSPPISDADLFDGIHTFSLQDDIIESDTDVFVEYIDIDGVHGFGKITSWHCNPYDLYGEDANEDYAYILTETGGTTYAHEGNIVPMYEVIENETRNTASLSPVCDTITDSWQSDSASRYAILHSVQPAAYLYTAKGA